MNKPITLTEYQIWNYMLCPAHFEMTRRKVISSHTMSYRSLIDRLTKMFFVNLMDGTVLSTDSLKKEWDSLCVKNPTIIDQRSCVRGYAAIMKLYDWAERNRLRILDCAVPYSILVTGRDKQPIDVRGEIPCIGVNQGNQVEILIIDYGEKRTSQVRTDMNLKYTLYCFAYRKQIRRDIGIHVRNLKYDEDIFSFRTENDFKRVERTIADISYSINKELFYPREGLGCLSCNVAGACRVWH